MPPSRRGTRRAVAASAAALLVTAAPIAVQAQAGDGTAAALPAVEVIGVAYRSGRPLDDVTPTVTAIGRDDIEQGLVFDLRGLLRYEPGVSIDNAPARFGLGNIAIRGVEGNRVVLLLDGIRLPESYRVGSFSSATRNPLDLGLLQRVEILRGPGSALYGSDALAGVIAFTTIDPVDVAPTRGRLHAVIDAGYASADDSVQRGLVVAGRGDAVGALVAYQRSDGDEVDNRGDDARTGTLRTAPNPQQRVAEAWLAKLTLATGSTQGRVTLDRHRRGADTDVLSLNPQSARTTQLDGHDIALRERVSADLDWQPARGVDRLRALVYAQRAVTVNDTADLRTGTTATCLSAVGTVDCLREVRFRFEQREDGASLIADVERAGRWVLGIEAARLRADESRSGQQTNLNTGAVGTVVGGEPLPTRDFPLSTTDRLGLFVQDEIALGDGRVTLVPAVRHDRFRVRPRIDPVFANGNPGRDVVALDDDAYSPKLGLLWRVLPGTTVSLQWAAGFRAPPATDINIGLSSLPIGFAVVPNPDLRAERSRGLELGVRARRGRLDASAAVFSTRYRDLIVSRAPLPCPGAAACVPGATATFQSQNIAQARIQGAEAAAAWRIGGPWRLQAVFASAVGDDTGRDRPLNSVDPARLTVGLVYDAGGIDAGLHLTHVREKKRIDTSAATFFAPPASTTADLTASVEPLPGLRLSAGVFNLTDRKTWLWSDLRGVPNPVAVDRYTQPGRNWALRLRAAF